MARDECAWRPCNDLDTMERSPGSVLRVGSSLKTREGGGEG